MPSVVGIHVFEIRNHGIDSLTTNLRSARIVQVNAANAFIENVDGGKLASDRGRVESVHCNYRCIKKMGPNYPSRKLQHTIQLNSPSFHRVMHIPGFLRAAARFSANTLFLGLFLVATPSEARQAGQMLLLPERVFDGESMHEGYAVLVDAAHIADLGPREEMIRRYDGVERKELENMTLMPGIIEGHSHVLLHPYDETSWNDQVLVESRAERVARGVVHLDRTLRAGVTTIRDLGTEGAGYDDVGLRQAVTKGVIPGPRMLVAGPAIVATGSYGPKGFREGVTVPLGAQVADGHDGIIRVVREQIGGGADIIKVYADYRWGPDGEAMPTFSETELRLIVETAASSGRVTVAHAGTAEGMRRAVLAGVHTIEHGDGGTPDVFRLMAERGVVWYPTLAAVESIMTYGGWEKGSGPDPERIRIKKQAIQWALGAGVAIGMGGDVGVYTHGSNAREMELMVEYGLAPISVLRAATSLNADTFGLGDRVGRLAPGLVADVIAVEGNPLEDMSAMHRVAMVMQAGRTVR